MSSNPVRENPNFTSWLMIHGSEVKLPESLSSLYMIHM